MFGTDQGLLLKMQNMTLGHALSYAAGLAFRAHNGDLHAATQEFCSLLTRANYPLPANPHQFVALWGPRLDDAGEIESHAARSGRHPQLTEQQVATCYLQCIGWWQAGRSGPYRSVADLVSSDAIVHAIVNHSGVTNETLASSLKAFDPHLQYGKVRGRPFLDEQHRSDRMAECARKLRTFRADKRWVVWVDEKVLCFSKSSAMGWFSTNAEDYGWRLPTPKHGRQDLKIKYIIAVNYVLGPVWIKFYTGTSGMPADREGCAYRVSSHAEQHGWPVGSHVLHCHPHCCCPARAAALRVVRVTRMQPQHAETVGECCSCQCLILGLPIGQGVTPVVTPAILFIYVLLPLHLNQQAGRLQQHHIPLVHVQPHPTLATCYIQLYLPAYGSCLNCIHANCWLMVQHSICLLLISAALARTHTACKRVPATFYGLQLQKTSMLHVAALALKGMLAAAVCCVALQQHVVHSLNPSAFGFLAELSPGSAWPCRCNCCTACISTCACRPAQERRHMA